jgi:hypothetical protein
MTVNGRSQRHGNDLSPALINQIMNRFGTLREARSFHGVLDDDLVDLTPEEMQKDGCAEDYLYRHLEFLRECGYIAPLEPSRRNEKIGTAYPMKLTARGEAFVQPELASYLPTPASLPRMMGYMEEKIMQSSYEPAEKESWIFKLREAAINKAPDALAACFAEVLTRFVFPRA